MPDQPSPADTPLSPADMAKRAAAARALEMVEDGMTLGLGTGSTAAWFVRLLSERIRSEGLDVVGVATSSTTKWLAEELGVPLRAVEKAGRIDLTVDGTDEFDAELNLIKGGGAALLQEKIVASASERLVVVADAGKRVAALGAFPLPVEVVRFGWPVTRAAILRVLVGLDLDGRRVEVRPGPDGAPLTTDEGHHILDLHLGRIGDPVALAAALSALPGVVEHGLFIGMADQVVVGHEDGATEVLRSASAAVTEAMRNEDA
jgi:ribose 5-phosphate isomerase A